MRSLPKLDEQSTSWTAPLWNGNPENTSTKRERVGFKVSDSLACASRWYGHSDMTYITDRIERLRKIDAYNRLVTVHDHAYCSKHPELVDFISIQIWTSELFAAMKDVRAKHPQKPIFNIEHGGYEAGPYHVFTGD